MGGVLSAPQLFGEAPVRVIADQDVDAIAVEGEGPPILGAHLLEDGGVAVQVLGGAEVQGEYGTGGIIDGAVQGHGGAAGLEPGKGAGIDLDQLPHPGLWRPAVSVLPRPAAVLRRQAQGAAPAADQFAADAEALHLAQLLGGVAVIEVLVAGVQQGVDLRRDRRRQAARRRPPAPAVEQARRPLGLQPDLQPLDVSGTDAQSGRPLRVGHLTREHHLQQARPRHFLSTHREGLPWLHGVTLSRCSQPRHFYVATAPTQVDLDIRTL